MIALIFKQNSPSIFQNHIEHLRIIDFNGEFCPKINGVIQPKVNCFFVSIFFVQAVAMWETIWKCAAFACFLKCSLNSASVETRGEGQLVGAAAAQGGLSSPRQGKTLPMPGGQGGLIPKPPFPGWFSPRTWCEGTARPGAAKRGDPHSAPTHRSGLSVLFSLCQAYGTCNSGFVENWVSL